MRGVGDYAHRLGEDWMERWLRGCRVGLGDGSVAVQGGPLVGV